jgi:hypothetical protein
MPTSSFSTTIYCTLQRTNTEKFETNIPRKGIVRPQSQFPRSCARERFVNYNPTIDLPILLQEICGPILGIYIYRSQTHECGNLD